MSTTSDTDPFFVIGTGRCGTTLIQRMLMAHPHINIPPETHFFSRFDPIRVIGADPVPPGSVDEYISKCTEHDWFGELGLDADAFDAVVRDGSRSARDLFLWMLETLLPESPRRPGEKTPHHEKYVDRILNVFPGARFIHIVRDPRDVVLSLKKEHWMRDESTQRVAHHVAKVLRRQWEVRNRLGAQCYHLLRYEDLIANPEVTLREVCEFLGETFEPEMLTFHEKSESGFLESEASWKSLTMSPLDPSRIERYKSRLSPRDIGTIERRLGRTLRAYGYEADPKASHAPILYLVELAERISWTFRRTRGSVQKRLSDGTTGEAGT